MADGNGSAGNGRHRDDDIVRARFNEVSDAILAALADERELGDVRRLTTEFYLLQERYLRGVVGKRLHDDLRANDGVEDVVMYIAAQLFKGLRRGRKVHWHMLFAIYMNCMVSYRRTFDRRADRPGTPDGGVSDETPTPRAMPGDADEADPVEHGEHASLVSRVHDMLHDIAAGPDEIRHPGRLLAVINYHLADVTNNAEIARKLDVPEGTLKREWNEFRAWAKRHYPDLRDFLPLVGDDESSPAGAASRQESSS